MVLKLNALFGEILGRIVGVVAVTIIIIQHHMRCKQTFISNKTKHFRKIHFERAVICFTKLLICSGSLLCEPGGVFHFPSPQIGHHTENPSLTSPRFNFLSALCFSHIILLG